MSRHVWRPLLVVLALVAVLFVFRYFYVPSIFGVHEPGFTYGWYRAANIFDWRAVAIKYQGRESCTRCHQKQVDAISGMPPTR